MKFTHKNFLIALFSVAFLTSCSSDDDSPNEEPEPLEVETVENLYAPSEGEQGQEAGSFTKFSFSTGTEVEGDNWDIAFRGTTIIVNGGTDTGDEDEPERTGNAAIALITGIFDEITEAPEDSGFAQDGAEGYALPKDISPSQGWYSYNMETHIISPVAGKVLVIRTHDDKYVKMEILSYYKDAPANPDQTSEFRYYTFNYIYQPDGSKSFE
ncbi:HmuY family protein [Sinomicrobium kalidii]|uniref:HmuY family protein n=1 Tax=Sinomicrobium kalidii TaxID=2900738 RepID=UPI001E34AB64|nr:HmuY family protein [Sinomicrobium kalidii]UGU14593.1 HmuY family protein [Sinomicrobium kalidii]